MKGANLIKRFLCVILIIMMALPSTAVYAADTTVKDKTVTYSKTKNSYEIQRTVDHTSTEKLSAMLKLTIDNQYILSYSTTGKSFTDVNISDIAREQIAIDTAAIMQLYDIKVYDQMCIITGYYQKDVSDVKSFFCLNTTDFKSYSLSKLENLPMAKYSPEVFKIGKKYVWFSSYNCSIFRAFPKENPMDLLKKYAREKVTETKKQTITEYYVKGEYYVSKDLSSWSKKYTPEILVLKLTSNKNTTNETANIEPNSYEIYMESSGDRLAITQTTEDQKSKETLEDNIVETSIYTTNDFKKYKEIDLKSLAYDAKSSKVDYLYHNYSVFIPMEGYIGIVNRKMKSMFSQITFGIDVLDKNNKIIYSAAIDDKKMVELNNMVFVRAIVKNSKLEGMSILFEQKFNETNQLYTINKKGKKVYNTSITLDSVKTFIQDYSKGATFLLKEDDGTKYLYMLTDGFVKSFRFKLPSQDIFDISICGKYLILDSKDNTYQVSLATLYKKIK